MKQHNDNADNLSNAKAIRAALEKICYEAAPEPLAEEIKKEVSFQIFPQLLSIKEVKMLSLVAEKYDLNLFELSKSYQTLREIYWENELQFKHDNKDDDFLKSIGVKW